MSVNLDGIPLYNSEGNQIQPQTNATCIYSNAVIHDGSTVHAELANLLQQIQNLSRYVTGAEQVGNDFGVEVKYATSNSDSIQDAARLTTYSENFVLPSSNTPYTWKRTIYSWASQPIGNPIYEIVAAALYPETQVMYTALGELQGNAIKGPSQFGTNIEDYGNPRVRWNSSFPGIGPETPYGYMAIRHRDAGQQFRVVDGHPTWDISLFAQYPIQQ